MPKLLLFAQIYILNFQRIVSAVQNVQDQVIAKMDTLKIVLLTNVLLFLKTAVKNHPEILFIVKGVVLYLPVANYSQYL